MSIAASEITSALAAYLDRYPDEKALLAEPIQLLAQGQDFTSRRTWPMHVTVSALVTRGGEEVLLVGHRAYGILLQPGGHLEPTDMTLIDAAVRELVEETGIDPDAVVPVSQAPVYVEYGSVPARPLKDEPEHFHLDLGYAFHDCGRGRGMPPGIGGNECRLVPAGQGCASGRAAHRAGSCTGWDGVIRTGRAAPPLTVPSPQPG